MNKKILIVEDEVITAMNWKLVLKNEGFHVCTLATNGKQALTIYSQEQPDMILMDVRLTSSLSGIETAKEILKSRPSVPIIFMTGYTDENTKSDAMQLNPLAYEEKPINIEKIVKIINSYFSSDTP